MSRIATWKWNTVGCQRSMLVFRYAAIYRFCLALCTGDGCSSGHEQKPGLMTAKTSTLIIATTWTVYLVSSRHKDIGGLAINRLVTLQMLKRQQAGIPRFDSGNKLTDRLGAVIVIPSPIAHVYFTASTPSQPRCFRMDSTNQLHDQLSGNSSLILKMTFSPTDKDCPFDRSWTEIKTASSSHFS